MTPPHVAAHILMGAVRSPLPRSGALGMIAFQTSHVRVQRDAARTLATGQLQLRDSRTGETTRLDGAMLHSGSLDFRTWLRPVPAKEDGAADKLHAAMPRGGGGSLESALATSYGAATFGVDALLDTGRRELLSAVFSEVTEELGRTYARLFHGNEGVIESLARLGLALPLELRVVAELACTRAFEQALAAATQTHDFERYAHALEIARLASERGVAVDRQAAVTMLGRALERLFSGWDGAGEGSPTVGDELLASARAAESVLDLAGQLDLALDLYRAQELYWQAAIASGWTATLHGEVRERVYDVGRRLGFSPDLLKAGAGTSLDRSHTGEQPARRPIGTPLGEVAP